MSEFDLIARLRALLPPSSAGVSGADDDAAVLPGNRLLATDLIVDGVHFDRALVRPADVGWKAIAVNVSDIAAMGGRPEAVVIGVVLPPGDDGWLEEAYAGVAEACRAYATAVVGGDVVSGGALVLAPSITGHAARPVLRSGARPRDRVVLTGPLGRSAAGLAALRAGRDDLPDLARAYRRPQPSVAAGVALADAGATAMIDVSDGLGADLGHIAAASGVRIILADRLPYADDVAEVFGESTAEGFALGGGEDYVLAACLPPDVHADPVLEVGTVEDGPPDVIWRGSSVARRGWDHRT